MTEQSEARGQYVVEGYLDGAWELVTTCDDREAAIVGAGGVAVSGAYDHVRLIRRDAAAGTGWRELVRIDRSGTVRNGAFVKPVPGTPRRPLPLTADTLPPEPMEKASRRERPRPAMAIAGAVLLLAAGIAVGNWAIRVI